MNVRICDRCGVITVGGEGCICTTPYSLSEIRRRHQAAVESARIITAAAVAARPSSVVDNGVVARGPAAEARTDAASPTPPEVPQFR